MVSHVLKEDKAAKFLCSTKMQQDQKFENLSHCRFCGENNKMKHLLHFSEHEIILQDFIESLKIDFINLECNILPKSSCKSCYEFILQCLDFTQKIKQTQAYLLHIYKNSSDHLVDVKFENDDDQYFSSEADLTLDILKNKKTLKEDPHTKISNQKLIVESKFTKDLNSAFTPKIHPIDKYTTEDIKHKIVVKKKKHISTSKKHLNTTLTSKYIIKTWENYDWSCLHCLAKFNSMHAMRDHSKMVHAICSGFQCTDCDELFNYFNPFVEHVRMHIESLRLYCQYCNHKSLTAEETTNHVVTHWLNTHICTLCGEMLPSTAALERHKKAYKKAVLPQRCYKKKPKKVTSDISWMDYKWSCQDCSLPCPTIAALRAHSRDVHNKCFAMKCADCLTVVANYKQFVDHVTAHRECLKNYCPYCNARLNKSDIENHISTHITGVQKPCLGCGEIFPDSASLTQHKTRYDAPTVRGSSDAESLTCGVCQKKFPNGFQLRNHKVIHNEQRERDQICHTCGKAFFDAKTLTNHIKTHYTKTETCEICQKAFLTKQRLKVHISTHLEVKQFVCNECGKKFRRKSQLRLHLASHSDVMPFECATCSKRFRLQSYLKIHERQHTGIRPYSCEVCSEAFNHWGNCNRHMIRKHGVTFAKTKITAQGKLDINRETGETKKIDIGGHVREWCQEMLRPKKRGRKKKEV